MNKSCGPRWGKLVYQLPGVITFAYDLRLGSSIPHRKGIFEKYKFCTRSKKFINYPWSPKIPTKCCLGPQNSPKILGLENLENKNCQDENCNCQDESCMLASWNRWVDTNIHLDHSSRRESQSMPPQSSSLNIFGFILESHEPLCQIETKVLGNILV